MLKPPIAAVPEGGMKEQGDSTGLPETHQRPNKTPPKPLHCRILADVSAVLFAFCVYTWKFRILLLL